MSNTPHISRRRFLQYSALSAAAASPLALHNQLSLAADLNNGHPLAPKPSHFPAKAKHLIIFFMTGGMSHVDTFDHKPRLNKDHDKKHHSKKIKGTQYKFKQYGKSGQFVSDLFPNVAQTIDDFCFIHSLHNDSAGHSKATLAMHTGSISVPMPSIGAWVGYGLGTLNQNLPPFVVFAKLEPYTAHQTWAADFLPAYYRGLRITPPNPIPYLKNPVTSISRRELERIMLRDINNQHLKLRPGDLNLKSRIANFDTAYGLMKQAPEAFTDANESDETLALYGTKRGDRKSFGYQCLAARKLVERGVRVVQLFDVGSNNNWDNHTDMNQHRRLAANVDKPLAGLITDLKQRGLFDETLIVGCTEFGRTPWQDLTPKGRGHHARAFTCFLAGGGVKAGTSYGQSDELGNSIQKDPVHIHDFHATILHLLGLNHEKLTYHYGGRNFRLTDVSGKVIHPIIA